VQRFALLTILSALSLMFSAMPASAAGLVASPSHFYYKDSSGKTTSARIIRRYTYRIVHPGGRIDPKIDPALRRAATIAEDRANPRTQSRCWQYVKEALYAAGAVSSYPKSAYAYEAGEELTAKFGFQRLPVSDPYSAPVGAVLVYGGKGHVEIRTKDGFVSDYHSNYRCFYPLIAVYGKF
jgi:hypothetical protein